MEPSNREHPLESALEVVLRDLLHAEQDLDRATFRVHHAREAANSLQALVGQARATKIAEQVGITLPGRRVQGGSSSADAARRALERRQVANVEAREKAMREAVRDVNRADEERERANANAQRPAGDSAVADDGVEIVVTQVADEVYQEDVSSTDRVVQLLKEYEGKAIPRAMILEQFEKRGWMDASWSHPGPAVRMAIRRATEKGAVKMVGDGRYMYSDPGLLGDLPSGGDA